MKSTVMILISGILGILTLLSVMAVAGKSERSMALKSSLPSVIETAAACAGSEEGTAGTTEGYLSNFVQNFAVTSDSDSDLTVEVLKADEKKGVLSIRVKELFRYPNGRTGKTECQRTVIVNRFGNQEEKQCRVEFYKNKQDMESGSDCFKRYEIWKGEKVPSPADPVASRKHFMGWRDSNDYMADFSLPVEGDRIYYAEWQ